MTKPRDRSKKQYEVLHHPPKIDPEDVLTFIELDGFADDLARLDLDEDDYRALQILMMVQPLAPLIAGGGGLRKMRFAPLRWGTGKSGAARVCYVYYPQWSVILLVLMYSKDEMDDIPAKQLKAIRQTLVRVEAQLRKRYE
jgi:hypothetical protein